MSLFTLKRVTKTYIVANTDALKKARLTRGLSMGKISRNAGISVVFYSDIESGRKSCSESVRDRIVRALK